MKGAVDTDPEAAYYQSVEEYFVSRRGEPLMLSNADWHLVRKWKTAGVPLRVVLRGIRDALDSHAQGWSRERKVRSLSYCTAEVKAARERWERAVSLGQQDGLDVVAALRGFALDLEEAQGLGSRSQEAAEEIAAELRGRADGSRLDELSAWLTEQESRLLKALRQDADPEALARVEAEVDASLAAYRERMPARVLDQLRQESLARRLLEAHGLPRLSLFHLEVGSG